MYHKRQLDEAVAFITKATEIDPKNANAYDNLGLVLTEKGRLAEAIASYKKAIEFDPKNSAALLGITRVERLSAVRDKLPAYRDGRYKPSASEEHFGLADWHYIKKLYRTAVGLYAGAFAADPRTVDDVNLNPRYSAACCAALASASQGEDAVGLDEAGRADLRRQALNWLRADLTLRTRLVESGTPTDRAAALQYLLQWPADVDLAAVRDAAALAKLPEAERKQWQALWSEGNALLRKAQGQKP